MIVFAVTSRVLHDLYESARIENGRTDTKIAEDLARIGLLVQMAGCASAVGTFERYLRLIALYRPGLAGFKPNTPEKSLYADQNYTTSTFDDLIAHLEDLARGDPAAADAVALLRQQATDMLGDVEPRRTTHASPETAENMIDVEGRMRLDPSDPRLWISAGLAHLKAGNLSRGRHLLRRACASDFTLRRNAQQAIVSAVDRHWHAET